MSCDTTLPAMVWPEAKDPDDLRDYSVDFKSKLIRYRQPGLEYSAGVRVRLEGQSGLELECTTQGETGSKGIRLPSAAGSTVTDGSVVWTARAVSSASLVSTIVGTPTWTLESGVTASNAAISGQVATADLSGGTDGQDYTALVKATLSNGNSITAVCILKVRRAQRVCEA